MRLNYTEGRLHKEDVKRVCNNKTPDAEIDESNVVDLTPYLGLKVAAGMQAEAGLSLLSMPWAAWQDGRNSQKVICLAKEVIDDKLLLAKATDSTFSPEDTEGINSYFADYADLADKLGLLNFNGQVATEAGGVVCVVYLFKHPTLHAVLDWIYMEEEHSIVKSYIYGLLLGLPAGDLENYVEQVDEETLVTS